MNNRCFSIAWLSK